MEKENQIPKIQSEKDVTFSSEIQKKAIFLACCAELLPRTRREMHGQLTREDIAQTDALRGAVIKLGKSLEKIPEIPPEEWVCMGIPEFVPPDQLKELICPSGQTKPLDIDFINIAEFSLSKRSASFSQEKNVYLDNPRNSN
jgi:hypothetical protein